MSGKRGNGRALVGGNAGDPEQVRKQGETVEFARLRYLTGLRASLQTAEQREVWWTLLGRCHVFTAIFSSDGAVQAANAGRHDVGLELMADLIEANASLYLLMQKEAMEREERAAPPKPKDEETETDG